VSLLHQNSSDLLSYESSTSQDNWTSSVDTTGLDTSSFFFPDQHYTAPSTLTPDLSTLPAGLTQDLQVSSAPLSNHFTPDTTDNMSTMNSTPYHHAFSHAGGMAIQDHSPQLLHDLWAPVDDMSISNHVSTSNSPAMESDVSTAKASSISTTSTSNSSRKRSATPVDATEDRAEKRRRNNIAAAKYRQKKVDRIEELEGQLQAVVAERDDLKIALAKRDAEVELLRKMLENKR
jgi:hypothetical protein